jgi:tetratricopeptide (TPR) repeat protein
LIGVEIGAPASYANHAPVAGLSFMRQETTATSIRINFCYNCSASMLTRFVSFAFLLAAFCGSACASTGQWLEVRSPHFIVLTDSNEKQARHIADQFERMRWLFLTLFPKANVDPVSPIVVLAAKNERSFQSLEPEAYLAKGQIKLGGLFMRTPDKNYVLLRLDTEQEHPFAAIYHEYTHLQFSPYSEWMPLWLNEGLAEFIQNTEIRDKDVQLDEASADDILYLRQHQLISLDVLFKVDTKSPYYHEEQKGSVFYAESWALTHYLFITDRQKGTRRIDDYMALLVRHEDPVTAAEKAFGNLKQLQSALEEYIRRSAYTHFVVSTAAAPIDESSYKVKVLTQAESDAACADFLANDERVKDALTLLDAVLKAGPNNVQARETMGSIEFRGGHMDAARKWYAEAARLGSQNYLVHYYYATLSSMELGDPDQGTEIEASLRTAIRLNPRFLPAYEQLASVLISKDRYSDAKAVLQDSVKAARTSGEIARVRRRIVELEQIQAEQARAAANVGEEVSAQATESSGVVDVVPSHPTEPPDGPKHEIVGVIRGVQCSYPALIDFRVEGAKKIILVYSNNYYKLDISALGFTPEGDLNPCIGLEGMKARVQYAESSDKTVDGQVVAVELRK